MKIFGKHNTKSNNQNLKHQVAKMLLDKTNGSLCVNNRLLDLLGIERKEDAKIVFIEDDNGIIGIAKTEDTQIGLGIYWYKSDSRCRIFNTTMVDYLVEKFQLNTDSNSYHFVFNPIAKKIKQYKVYQVKEIFPYIRRKHN